MAMILISDIRKEEQSRHSVIKPKRCIDDLTNELLVEILQRVPCKSALRLKSVSKRWFALISDPHFTHSFLCYHTNEKLQPREFVFNFYLNEFLVTSQFPEVSFPLSLSFLPCFQTSLQLQEQEKPCVVGSSNGLLLCCCTTDYQSIYYVCNPLTKHWVVLPSTPSFPEMVLVGFICDPPVYCNTTSSKCSFKVVRLCTLHGNESAFKVETFSSKTGQWTDSVVSCPQGSAKNFVCNKTPVNFNRRQIRIIDFCNKTAIEYNGRLHWHVMFRKVILVYHLNDDKVTFINCPRLAHLRGDLLLQHCKILGVSRGCLRMSHLRVSDLISCLSIWELKDYNKGEWCLEHQIHIKDLMWNNSPPPNWEPKPPRGHVPYVLAFHPYADVMYLGFSQCFASCDLPTKTSTFLSDYPYELPPKAQHHGQLKFDFLKLVGFTLVFPPWPTPVPALPT